MALTIVNRTRDDRVVCARTEVADNLFKRLRGLLGRASLRVWRRHALPRRVINSQCLYALSIRCSFHGS